MRKQDGHLRPLATYAMLILLLMLSLFAASAVAGEINACKYLVVTDFSSDPYGIAEELREQARAKGFSVITAIADLSPADSLMACVMNGSWWRTSNGGRLSMRVVDAASGASSTIAALCSTSPSAL